jgi:subtilase family serine protease
MALTPPLLTTIVLTTAGLTTVGLACAGVGTGGALAAPVQQRPSAARVPITGTHPAWAIAARAVAGPNATTSVTTRVYLAGRDPAGLAAYAAAVATPRNRSYRKYLTTAQERERYGPTAAQIAAVRTWLAGSGFRITSVTPHYVAVTGPVTAADAAFAVRLGRYRTPEGSVAVAPDRSASVPAALRPAVLTVTGLDSQPELAHPALPGPPAGFYTARPCSSYWGQRYATSQPTAYGSHVPWAICGYTPDQLRSAYGLSASLATGAGVTVAIVDAYGSPTMPADADEYAADEGDPAFSPGQYEQLPPTSYDDATLCGASAWYQEQTLDIEAVHAMAPDAKVVYVGASDCTFQPLLDALTRIVDYHLADVVTDSWTSGEQGTTTPMTTAYNQVFEQGAVEGIGFNFAAGDCGYNDPGTSCATADGYTQIQANFPSSSPWVTAVGGTTLAIGQSGNYEWETGWGDQVVPRSGKRWKTSPPGEYPDDFAFGGGGGTSTLFQQPAYQAGVVPKSLSTRLPDGTISKQPMRELPDVAMDADPATGFLLGETVKLRGGKDGFQLTRVGGTSLAAPLFAGLEADAAQYTGPHALGFLNPVLYSLAGTGAFHDVTDWPLGPDRWLAAARNEWSNATSGTGKIQTSLYTFGLDGSGAAALQATRGYDNVTGLGSPGPDFIADVSGT